MCVCADLLSEKINFVDTDSKYPQVLFFNVSTTTQITPSGVLINRLEDMGISISVPEGSVSSHMDLHIRPCFSGPYQLPQDYEPASPAYLIWHSGKTKPDLLKDVTVKIYHNTCLESEEDCKGMAFFSASSKPEYMKENHPVYTFKKMHELTQDSEKESWWVKYPSGISV